MTELVTDFEKLTLNIDNENETLLNKLESTKETKNVENKILSIKYESFEKSTSKTPKKNKGIGAGGKETNVKGKEFEELTNNSNNLLKDKYIKKSINKSKFGHFLNKKIDENVEINFVLQSGLKTYFEHFHKITMFRNPDEAYIIKKGDTIIVKILEKKEQSVEGSVETKLWAGPSLKREYELILHKHFGEKVKVEYAYTLSKFLQDKMENKTEKFNILKTILEEANIKILYGNNADYLTQLNDWINNY